MRINWLSLHLKWFQIFKYCVYALLIRNVLVFFAQDSTSAAILEIDGITAAEFITVYAATIDTLSWIILLVMFELETWLVPKEKMTTRLHKLLITIRGLCYLWIIYALYGYINTYFNLLNDWVPITLPDAGLCTQIGQAFMYSLERFHTITAANCAGLASSPELLMGKTVALTDVDHYGLSKSLAAFDIVNAAAWILIVALLEFEVLLQNRRFLTHTRVYMLNVVKGTLYFTLFAVAIGWWFFGEFIDFWDAFLWIVAFLFIENNMLKWDNTDRIMPVETALE